MFASFSFTTILFTAIASLLILFITVFIIIPLKRMSFYRRKDSVLYFFPVLGFFKKHINDLNTKHDFLASIKEFSKQYPDKKILVTNLGTSPRLQLRDPQYVKEFFQNQSSYRKADILKIFVPLAGTGLVLSEGETWKRHRKIISNSFHYEFIKTNIDLIQDTTRELLDKTSESEYKDYPIISKIQEITGEIVGRIFFGENLSNYKYKGKSLTMALADIIMELSMCGRSLPYLLFGLKVLKLPIFPKFAKVMSEIQEFRKTCAKIINDRKIQQKESNDLLASLIATQKSDNASQRFSDDEIIDEFITFFVAGMDTTGHLISMVIYNLHQYPQYLDDLQKERESAYNKEEKVTADTLQKMDILHSLLKETLRFHTPAPFTFPRVAIEDHKLGDLQVKKGISVRPDFMSLFFDERYFEKATEFNPYRWMTPDQKIDSYVFIPFSAGPRNCIGQHLAIIESKIILSEFLNRFDFRVDENYKFKMIVRFLYEPYEELKLQLSRRG